MERVRNIGISAHIDSGKTTLTERILFYTGRINAIHEVRGKDGVGAKMDSMDLEREKGITIQSAATYTQWKDSQINIIDTPGHVDFTIEVERALRVLDGAILVLCSVGGVQSQSITVDRQMRRYSVPRLAFINKCDRSGADPWKVMEQMREKLRLPCAALQIPIGLENQHEGLVDLVRMKAYYFEGANGEKVVEKDIPADLAEQAAEKRYELIEKLADFDEDIAMLFLEGEEPDVELLKSVIRRTTIANEFVPVFMGSAFKNRGVQSLLDGVTDYLPSPLEVENVALDLQNDEAPVTVKGDPKDPMIGLAFKLEEGKYGQLTYLRLYQGTISRGDNIFNMTNGKKCKVPRLVRMHSDDMQDIQSASSGDIVALFGVDCASGDTFTDGKVKLSMTSIKVPEPVMSLAVAPKSKDGQANFSKALNRFTREDPTFTVKLDPESSETIISGMGELHLEIYIERMKREYKIDVTSGKPRVNFRERVNNRANFNYVHKKQSGGQGQYAKVMGYIEPLEEGSDVKFEFVNNAIGNNIPPGFIPAIEKGFLEAINCGSLIGYPVEGVRFVLEDGAAHAVDSSELAFRLGALGAFRQAYFDSGPTVMEPVMDVTVIIPNEFQGNVMGALNRSKGMILNTEQEGDDAIINALVPLNNMFGYSTSLRSMTQGKGEFTMEYGQHMPVPRDVQNDMVDAYKKSRSGK
eukprot:CAMPEP_0197854974 /NCGR_PEP_ID=MMETSP1438-20131217/25708_1 /TAXON_ID=1461541 /ORGANISM="Pterosperma sp., Strain CCMP1384" /LENGTH=693 /DNA_ID=CAMNT_0043469923 /DNA_START=326 /DNA_END=2407 /DNA_ORIENTATION=+